MTPQIWKALRRNEDFDGPWFEPDEGDPPYPFTRIASATETIVNCHDLATIKDEHAYLMAAAPDLQHACELLLDALTTGGHELLAIHTATLALHKSRGLT